LARCIGPGEAAQAKRRISALTLGHIPPPLAQSHTPDAFVPLENLLDEFSNADGLDPKRRDRLMDQIRDLAQSLGVEQDLGIADDVDQGEALTRIDRFVCDIKEAQFADGLHVFGRMGYEGDQSLAAHSEREGLRRALCGHRIDSGPAGSPYRGRSDVLPTGRNLFSVDPLSVPSRAAYEQGCILADELVRRHLQDHGDWPKSLVVDLWGSATMRTAGEEFAMALALMGVRPVWAEGSERITGTEIIPLAEMDRPRIDATLRISGLFRDVFPTLSVLYNQAVRTLAARDEAPDWNPFTDHDQHRVFGPAPGEYGVAMQGALDDYSDAGVADAGTAWLAQSSWSIDGDNMDVLMAADYAAHEAGFAAAKAQFGQQATLYHLDTTNPSAPKARTLKEEIAKTVMARAANPDWINGMMRHGFRGGAEMAATLDHMGAFANLAKLVEAHHFDRYFQETLGRDDVVDFLREHNPQALDAMIERFHALAAQFHFIRAGAVAPVARMTRRPAPKGWCPSSFRPMESGDGYIVRIKPTFGRVTRDQLEKIAHLADQFGNGIIELTNRANLQLRGVSIADHPALIDALVQTQTARQVRRGFRAGRSTADAGLG